jgi:hypothetical protein
MGQDFTLPSSGDEAVPEPIGGALPVAAAQALLALQEVPVERQGRRAALRRGSDLLDRLDDIRHDLLLGDIPLHRLEALAHRLREPMPPVTDPRIADLIQEIELRVAVELAKFGR